MRTLLGLTLLMVVLAAAVWWKTRQADGPDGLPPTSSASAEDGIVTVGLRPQDFGQPAARKPSTAKPRDAAMTPATPSTPGPADWEGSTGDTPHQKQAVDPGRQVSPAVDPQPEPSPAPVAVSPAPLRYQVAQGDTFYGIVSRAYGRAPEALREAVAKANGLQDPSQLAVGQSLLLPEVSGYPAPKRP